MLRRANQLAFHQFQDDLGFGLNNKMDALVANLTKLIYVPLALSKRRVRSRMMLSITECS